MVLFLFCFVLTSKPQGFADLGQKCGKLLSSCSIELTNLFSTFSYQSQFSLCHLSHLFLNPSPNLNSDGIHAAYITHHQTTVFGVFFLT